MSKCTLISIGEMFGVKGKSLVQQHKASSSTCALWRNRDYLLLWGGGVISITGSQVSQLAFPLLLLTLTHSLTQTGIVTALRILPYVILGLPVGVLVDRWNRKLVMIICDLGRFVCMASIAGALAFGHITLFHLYLVALIEGIFFVLFDVAEVSCLPNVVSKEQLPAATAQNSATYNISTLLGSPLGGLLYSLGSLFPFLVDAISYLCSVLSLLFIQISFQQERASTTRSFWKETLEGVKWLWQRRRFRFLALLLCGLYLVTVGLSLIVIVLGQRLHASVIDIGLLFSVAGVAGILGAAFTPLLLRRFGLFSLALCTLWPQTLLLLLLLVAPNIYLLRAIIAAFFFLFPIFDIVQRSQRLVLIPDTLQGRVNSVYRIIVFSGRPVSLALTGVLLQNSGITTILLLTGGWHFLP